MGNYEMMLFVYGTLHIATNHLVPRPLMALERASGSVS
jgi:hypothetical protein